MSDDLTVDQTIAISLVLSFIIVFGFSGVQLQAYDVTPTGSGFEGVDYYVEALEVLTTQGAVVGYVGGEQLKAGLYTKNDKPEVTASTSKSIWDFGLKRVHVDFDDKAAGLPDVYFEGGYVAQCTKDGSATNKIIKSHEVVYKRGTRDYKAIYYLYYFKFEVALSSKDLTDANPIYPEHGHPIQEIRFWVRMGTNKWAVTGNQGEQWWSGILSAEVLEYEWDTTPHTISGTTPSRKGVAFDLYSSEGDYYSKGIEFPSSNQRLNPSAILSDPLIPITVNKFVSRKYGGIEYPAWAHITVLTACLVTVEFDVTKENFIDVEAPPPKQNIFEWLLDQILAPLLDLLGVPFEFLILIGAIVLVAGIGVVLFFFMMLMMVMRRRD